MAWLQPTIDAAGQLPVVAYLPACTGLVAGLLLLLAGNKVLKPVTLVLGAAAGGLLGVIVLTSTLEGHTYDCPPALASLGVGAIVGSIIAFALFRAALALAGAATFAALAVLIAGVLIPHSQPTLASKVEFGIQERVMLVSHALDPNPSFSTSDRARETAEVTASHARDYASLAWGTIPNSARARLILIGLAAGVAGLVAGAFMPRKTESLVTALLGGAVVLLSLTWLVDALEVPAAGLLNHGFLGWLVIWGGVSAAGLAVQFWTGRKATPKAA